VEKRFGLRKCPPERPDADTYRHCINDIVRYCAAPCIGRVSPGAYRARCDEACAFLRGERPAVLKELRAKMAQAAAALDYERAAALRDTLLALEATVRQRARVAPTPALERRAGLAGVAELQRALRLPSAPHTIEAYDISNISGTYAVGSLVCAADGIPRRNRYRRFRIRTVEGRDDVAMMAEIIRRRFGREPREAQRLPDLVLLDGGLPQLHAARGELRRLGLGALPCAALAKRLEEIHRDEIGQPVRLPGDSPALKVLQRIRDEAHRFAFTYHRHLRGRLIRESVLDEVPGVGPKRKRRLLERFGSVRRLAQAGAEEIARAAPGIGLDAARAVKRVAAVTDPKSMPVSMPNIRPDSMAGCTKMM